MSAQRIAEYSVERFLETLASAAPTPGGGSAAAVMGAAGAALIAMVCNVSTGKKACAAVEAELAAIRRQADDVRARLTAMIAEDVAAFDGLMASYKLPKASDEEQTRRAVAIQTHLRGATDVPMACARACAEVIDLAARVSHIGYQGVISDAGVGVLAAYAALRSAALNVFINAPALNDRPLADRYVAQIGELATAGGLASERVYKTVRQRLES